MKPKYLYLALCILGTALPYSQFLLFLRDHGLDVRLFLAQLFANHVSGSFALDIMVSSVALWALVYVEGGRSGMRRLWVPVAANLVVGLSLGLPLFLYMREVRRPTPRPLQELRAALAAAGGAHHQYEQEYLRGVRDEQWAGFYAAYVLGRLGDVASPTSLTRWLQEAPGDDDWATAAARHVTAQLP